MMDEGLSEQAARDNIFMLNSKGLITKDRVKKEERLTPRHGQFAKDLPEMGLLEVVKMVKPHALLGISTVGGAFTPEIIQEMAKNHPRPIIFALSNPTDKAECTAEDAYNYTNIGNYLYENDLATLHPEPEDKEMYIRSQVYNYEYEPSINEMYSWPEKDARHGFPVPVLPRTSMDDE
ncbi:hypothetical protein GCK32_013666 [Trichostrongylus colubriformis]|uniref:Malic enzyme NAD-binding domain-containing protein n=1 Tax=Trichostrongylus colubriformis TaxID=6319 RepID=A0AAN8J3M0_TRICO